MKKQHEVLFTPMIEGKVPNSPMNFDHILVSASDTPNVWDSTVMCRELTKEEIHEITL